MNNANQLKIVIIGCGRMACNHLNQIIRWIPKEQIALCDLDRFKTNLLAKMYEIPNQYHSIEDAIQDFSGDVYHILTPPQTHTAIAKQILAANGHVYIEKPLCLNVDEVDDMVEASIKYQKQLCVGHQRPFEQQFLELKQIVEKKTYGNLIHIAGYDSAPFIKMENLGLGNAWSADLTGGMFTDLLPHFLSMYVELIPELKFHSQHVANLPDGRPSDLYAHFSCSSNTTASIHYSFSTELIQNTMRLEFENGYILVDIRNGFTISYQKRKIPGVLERILFNFYMGRKLLMGGLLSAPRYILGKLNPYEGVEKLIFQFYQSIQNKSPSPTSHQHMRQVVQLTQECVEHAFFKKDKVNNIEEKLPTQLVNSHTQNHQSTPQVDTNILITGGTGFIGKHLVQKLLDSGAKVRLISRKPIPEELFKTNFKSNLDVRIGSLVDAEFVKSCTDGIQTVYHLAGATKGDIFFNLESSCTGTENLLEAIAKSQVKKLVYTSSVSIFDQGNYPSKGYINNFTYEPYPLRRGAYTYAKLEAEKLVLAFQKNSQIAVDILRPGLVWGPGKPQLLLETNVRLWKNFRIVFGNRKKKLPLIYVENLVDAILLAGQSKTALPEPINLVDSDIPRQKDYLKLLNEKTGEKNRCFYIPIGPMVGIAWLADRVFKLVLKKKTNIAYQFKSKKSMAEYDNSPARKYLNWESSLPFSEALDIDLKYNGNNECN